MSNDRNPSDLAKQRPIRDFGWLVTATVNNYFRSERKAREHAQRLVAQGEHMQQLHPGVALRFADGGPWFRPGPVAVYRIDPVVEDVAPPAPPAQDIPEPLQAFMDNIAAALGDAIGGGPDGVYRFPVHVTGSGLVVPGRCGRPNCACAQQPQD